MTGAGAAGVDLITTVTVTSGTILTLGTTNASGGTLTNTKINHDDTAAIAAALATTQNVEFPAGQYNVTIMRTVRTITIAGPQWMKCAGAGVGSASGSTMPLYGGTVIWNRSATGNAINITSHGPMYLTAASSQASGYPSDRWLLHAVGSGMSSTLIYWMDRT